jgi:biotin transport system substrate-specific component
MKPHSFTNLSDASLADGAGIVKRFSEIVDNLQRLCYRQIVNSIFISLYNWRRIMKFSTRDLCFCAIGAALIAVCAWISIPAEVPFTLQTFAIFAVCGLLGGKRGTVSVLVYLLLGAVGAPVFAGFRGGFAALIGTTGGYLVGFILLALIIALAQARWGLGQWVFVLSAAVGLLVCYAFGTAWFLIVYTRTGAITLGVVLAKCVLPFLLPDAIKLALATLIRARLYRRIPA